MKKRETDIDTLVREVREESGLDVIPDSAEYFGMTKRKEKGIWDYILLQDSHYYTCRVTDRLYPQELGKKETLAQFELEYVDPRIAIEANEKYLSGHSDGAIVRDNLVLKMIVSDHLE